MWGAIWSKVLIMKKGSQNGKGTLSTSDRTGHLRDITPGKVSTHPQKMRQMVMEIETP